MFKAKQDRIKTDVLVVGGGMVGCSLAAALAGVGFDVVIVDQTDAVTQTQDKFDGRASAVARASKKMLDQIGMWKHLGQNYCPILDIRVTDEASSLFLHYDHLDVGGDAMGFMVENRHFRQAIHTRLKDFKNVTYCAATKIAHVDRRSEGVRSTLTNGHQIDAGLIVGADGRGSQTRRDAGIDLTSWSYDQTAIVLTVDHEISHHNVAHEHFLPAGPFAILPLRGPTRDNNRSTIVWTERNTLVEDIMALSGADFAVEFNSRFGNFLGATTFIGPRWSYPLTLQYAKTSLAERLVLVGDAAHGMHPIAGQGLNMGLRDVAALAEVLTDARRLGFDIGSKAILADYEKWRRFDNTMMLAMTDGLNRLFSNDIGPIKLARDIGLAAVNKMVPVKRKLMQHAMGVTGNLPRLLNGKAL